MRRGRRFGALAACGLLLVACGNTRDANSTGAGSSSAATTATTSQVPPPPIVSPKLLDAGKYPTQPRPALGVAGNPAAGLIADAQRLAEVTLGPWEVDAAIVSPYLNSYYVITSPNTLKQLGPEGIGTAAGQHGLIDGFASAREEPDKKVMIDAVLRFADPAAATAAAKDMGDAAAKQAIKGVTPTVVPIPGHPDAVASTYPFTPQGSTQVRGSVRSFTPHGPYVFMQFVQSVDGVDAATALAAKAIEAQIPLIDGYTPAVDLAAVPLDPTGLLAKTLPAAGANPAKNAVYGTRGAEHFQSNPIGSEKLFADAGITDVAMGSTNVYQAGDGHAAVTVTNSFSDEVSTEPGSTPADPVAPLPGSHCWALPQSFYCVAPAGRYAIEARSAQLSDVHQMVAAQYVMLTAT